MSKTINRSEEGLKLQEICRRIEVDYDDARYTLAKGVLPLGVKSEPGRGNHRVFASRQAFMLAIILKLCAAGVSLDLAKNIAELSPRVQGMMTNLGWDWSFAPFAGNMHSDQEWYLEIGDARYIRVVTNACPSQEGYFTTPWFEISTRRERETARPAIIFRIDIVRIAQLLDGKVVGD